LGQLIIEERDGNILQKFSGIISLYTKKQPTNYTTPRISGDTMNQIQIEMAAAH